MKTAKVNGALKGIRFGVAAALVLSACDAADDVAVLPLPELERPSAEARLGLPEVQGIWRFAGWEVTRGDSTALERTFPSFGELRIETQRLDSIAGAFVLAGGPARVIGDVRRSGHVSLVTFGPGGPGSFLAGEVERDTLWLELTSILEADEWPRDSRAAFVRTPVAEPIAWLRGARYDDVVPPPSDSLPAIPSLPPTGGPAGAARSPTGGGQVGRPGVEAGTLPGPSQPAAGGAPAGGDQPPVSTPPPTRQAPVGAQPPPTQPTVPPAGEGAQPESEPDEAEPEEAEAEPEEIEIEIPEPDLPPLLGDPVFREGLAPGS